MQDAYNLAVTAVVMIILMIITICVRWMIKRMHLRVQCQRGDVETGDLEDTGVQMEEVLTPTPPPTPSKRKNKRANPSPPPSPRVTRATKKGGRKGKK